MAKSEAAVRPKQSKKDPNSIPRAEVAASSNVRSKSVLYSPPATTEQLRNARLLYLNRSPGERRTALNIVHSAQNPHDNKKRVSRNCKSFSIKNERISIKEGPKKTSNPSKARVSAAKRDDDAVYVFGLPPSKAAAGAPVRQYHGALGMSIKSESTSNRRVHLRLRDANDVAGRSKSKECGRSAASKAVKSKPTRSVHHKPSHGAAEDVTQHVGIDHLPKGASSLSSPCSSSSNSSLHRDIAPHSSNFRTSSTSLSRNAPAQTQHQEPSSNSKCHRSQPIESLSAPAAIAVRSRRSSHTKPTSTSPRSGGSGIFSILLKKSKLVM